MSSCVETLSLQGQAGVRLRLLERRPPRRIELTIETPRLGERLLATLVRWGEGAPAHRLGSWERLGRPLRD